MQGKQNRFMISSHMQEEKDIIAEDCNLQKNRRLFRRYLLVFAVIFLIAGGFWLGYSKGKNTAEAESKFVPISNTEIINEDPLEKISVDFGLFWKTWDLLKEKYVNKNSLDAQQLVYGAIEGMLKATGDPYTSFFDPKETKEFASDMEGIFEGIGAELGIKDGILTVIAPLDDSPAQKAGIRAGDKILKIGAKITADMTIDEAVDMIRGEKGTEIKLTILHTEDEKTKEISIIRDRIEIKSVKLEFKQDSVAYLKINKFGEETSREFNSAASQIISKGTKGIIFDLRNNPGGFLDEAVEISSRVIPKDKVVVIEEDYSGKKETLYTGGGDKLSSIPAVVLINEGSASAAEILAGALRDNREIKLVGKKSFGKGSVQELVPLPGKTSVKITVAKWMTPNGDYIMDKGISPDIEVEFTEDDFKNNRDPQLEKALEIIAGLK